MAEIEVRLFGPFREAVEQTPLHVDTSDPLTVESLLRRLSDDYPGLTGQLFTRTDDLQPSLNITVDGRNVSHLDGTDTRLEGRTVVRLAPPVKGGVC